MAGRMAEVAPKRHGLEVPGVEDLTPVGRGGFATVYEGWQPDFHRHVAVKVLNASAADSDVAARFRREVMAMGALSDHPNVVPVYDAGIVDDRPYLVMPRLADESLDDELRRGPLPSADVVRLGIAMAAALEAAHRVGLLHRDVKPANVLRTAYGEPKLADFGIARFTDATATQGQLSATVAYAAPEVLSGGQATARSDVYSLGATMHAALRGAAPFEPRAGEVPVAMAVRILADPPPPLPADVPADLAGVVARAMAKAPDDRYPTADALREALVALGERAAVTPADPTVARQTIVVAPPPPTSPAPTPVAAAGAGAARTDRRRGATVAVGLLVVAVLAGLALASAGGDRRQPDVASPSSSIAGGAAEGPVTTAVTSTTAAPTTTTTMSVAPASGAADTTVRRYYALLDEGRTDDAFAMLTPEYQRQSGEQSYRGFWSTIDSVKVLALHASDDTARVTLRYTRTDGSTVTETNVLRLVDDGAGNLLIDGYAG